MSNRATTPKRRTRRTGQRTPGKPTGFSPDKARLRTGEGSVSLMPYSSSTSSKPFISNPLTGMYGDQREPKKSLEQLQEEAGALSAKTEGLIDEFGLQDTDSAGRSHGDALAMTRGETGARRIQRTKLRQHRRRGVTSCYAKVDARGIRNTDEYFCLKSPSMRNTKRRGGYKKKRKTLRKRRRKRRIKRRTKRRKRKQRKTRKRRKR